MKNLFSYNEFINENIFIDENGNKFHEDLWKNEVLLKDIEGLKTEEIEILSEYGYLTATQVYSIMTMKQPLPDNLRETLGINENRYNEIKNIIKLSLDPIVVDEIENYVPVEYSLGAKEPKN